jgi:hypothetical protein
MSETSNPTDDSDLEAVVAAVQRAKASTGEVTEVLLSLMKEGLVYAQMAMIRNDPGRASAILALLYQTIDERIPEGDPTLMAFREMTGSLRRKRNET